MHKYSFSIKWDVIYTAEQVSNILGLGQNTIKQLKNEGIIRRGAKGRLCGLYLMEAIENLQDYFNLKERQVRKRIYDRKQEYDHKLLELMLTSYSWGTNGGWYICGKCKRTKEEIKDNEIIDYRERVYELLAYGREFMEKIKLEINN